MGARSAKRMRSSRGAEPETTRPDSYDPVRSDLVGGPSLLLRKTRTRTDRSRRPVRHKTWALDVHRLRKML